MILSLSVLNLQNKKSKAGVNELNRAELNNTDGKRNGNMQGGAEGKGDGKKKNIDDVAEWGAQKVRITPLQPHKLRKRNCI